MSIGAKLAAAALAAAIITAGAPAHAESTNPQLTIKHCELTFKTLKALDLLDDGDSDFVIFQGNGHSFPGGGQSVEFFEGTEHTAAAFNHPIVTANEFAPTFVLSLLIDEPWPRANVPVAPVSQVLCGSPAGLNRTLRFGNGDADYLLTYDLNLPHL